MTPYRVVIFFLVLFNILYYIFYFQLTGDLSKSNVLPATAEDQQPLIAHETAQVQENCGDF